MIVTAEDEVYDGSQALIAGELVDDAPFFAPVASDLVDGLLGQYRSLRGRIESMATVVNGEGYAGALHHFTRGNKIEGRHVSPERIFELPGAIASLNATFWTKALALTDVLDTMPQKRRDEWNKSITEMSAPDFEEASVRATLTELLGMRSQFLAERVDGIFRVLSSDHVTNVPEGFGKRMIVVYVVYEWGSPDSSRQLTLQALPRHHFCFPRFLVLGPAGDFFFVAELSAARLVIVLLRSSLTLRFAVLSASSEAWTSTKRRSVLISAFAMASSAEAWSSSDMDPPF